VADPGWHATYAALLKQIRDMQRQLARAEAEARVFRDRAATEREKLRSIRPERRLTGRFGGSEISEERARKRRKKR